MSTVTTPSVLDVLPDLEGLADEAALPELRRLLESSVRHLSPGPWRPAAHELPPGAFGVVVLDGALLRESTLQGRRCSELLGVGDVVTPWVQPSGMVPIEVQWRAL